MEANKRIILNTSVQYIKAIVTTILSLFSMRIVLEAIGVSDYGIFSVVGGVIAMLGFITNALVITTQRYVSYYYGRHRTSQVKRFFTNSLFLHIILGLLIGLALLAIKGLLMNDFLKIDPDRLDAAKSVYDITVAILLVTVVTAPFKALFIAKENIVFIDPKVGLSLPTALHPGRQAAALRLHPRGHPTPQPAGIRSLCQLAVS